MYRVLAALFVSLGCQQPQSEAQSRDSIAPVASAGTVELPTYDDPALNSASRALAGGQPWRATQLLEPIVRDPARRSPSAVLLAAEAAAAWGGWTRVRELLGNQPWVDTVSAGRGRALLARASLERGANAEALDHARRAVETARTRRERGARLVVLARAHDRLDQRDSARVAYETAAEMIPEISDWLRLRAAGVIADSAERARHYASVRTPVARARIGITEAQARTRAGDHAGAARAYAAINMPVAALESRLSATSDAAERAAIRRDLLRVVETQAGSASARAAVELLDRRLAPLSPQEELLVARSAARSGPQSRAATGFQRAFAAKLGTSQDRTDWGDALFALGRYREAAAQYALVAAPPALAATTGYRRARSLLRAGDGAAARTALTRVASVYSEHPEAAASALYLLGDLATDDGDDDAARRHYREMARRYPSAGLTPVARFRAAIIAYVQGDVATAARELDTLATRYPSSGERNAADYWSGRAWAQLGDSATARARWRGIVQRDPLSYYAMVAARRLGEAPPMPAAAPDSFARIAAVDSAVSRAEILDRLGMDTEERLEYSRLIQEADGSVERMLATADALRDRMRASSAIRLGWRAIERGAPRDARTLRLTYPIVHESTLVASARQYGLDRALVAALIRQESSFEPRATSPVGARGLMQLMPSVGQQVARSLGFPVWDPALLYQPDVNLQLGTAHLKGLIEDDQRIARSLAAYNAGASRVARWSKRAGVADPEIFIERIPYVETRDYVRIVLRNRELYRSLYGW